MSPKVLSFLLELGKAATQPINTTGSVFTHLRALERFGNLKEHVLATKAMFPMTFQVKERRADACNGWCLLLGLSRTGMCVLGTDRDATRALSLSLKLATPL